MYFHVGRNIPALSYIAFLVRRTDMFAGMAGGWQDSDVLLRNLQILRIHRILRVPDSGLGAGELGLGLGADADVAEAGQDAADLLEGKAAPRFGVDLGVAGMVLRGSALVMGLKGQVTSNFLGWSL